MKRTKNSSLKFTWNTPEESGMRSPSTTASEPRNYIMNKSFKSFILFAPQNFLFSMTQAKGKKKHNRNTGCNYLQKFTGGYKYNLLVLQFSL